MVTDLCWYDTKQGDNCQWECSDIPGLFYCNNCDRLRQWKTDLIEEIERRFSDAGL